MGFYERHIFFCVNERDEQTGRACCARAGGSELQAYAKAQAKARNLLGEGKVRINRSGCLDRCELGPVAVVYPDGVWYRYFDEADVDEIIESHLIQGTPVERLLI